MGSRVHRLYGFNGSGSAAIEMALQAADIEYEVVEVASWERGTPIDELTGKNPLAQIPTLVFPDGESLTESAAILIHLALACPSSGLFPKNERMRAKAIQGLVYIAANCYAAVGIVDYPERWTTGTAEAERERIRAGTRLRLLEYWNTFADMFSPDCLLVDGAAGALDYLAVTVSRMLGAREQLKETRPRFHDLLADIERTRIVGAIVARHWPAR